MSDYDRILLVKNEVFVYKIGPRANNRGFRYVYNCLTNTSCVFEVNYC